MLTFIVSVRKPFLLYLPKGNLKMGKNLYKSNDINAIFDSYLKKCMCVTDKDEPTEMILKLEKLISVMWLCEYERKFGDMLNSSLESLCIPTIIVNALKKGGYRTVRDIVETPSKQTVRLWNIGEVSVKELAGRLRKNGFIWKANDLLVAFNDMRE